MAWDLGADWSLQRTIGAADAGSLIADRVNALRFSPDGKRLASGGGEPTRGGEIKIWQVADGKMQQAFTHVHSDEVFGVDFSADGHFLASGAADKFVKVLDLATGKVLKTFEGHNHHVLGVSWNQDGRTLASAGADDVIKVWDFVTGERKKTIEGFGKEVTSIGFVGITDQVLVSSGDHQICLVNENGDKVRSFEGGTDFMNTAAATSDGKIVIAAGQDGVLMVWNGTNGKVMASFAPPKTNDQVSFGIPGFPPTSAGFQWFPFSRKIPTLDYQQRPGVSCLPMRISKKTDYALRALFTLVEHHGGAPIPIRELARRNDAPKRFLEQIMLDLKTQGLGRKHGGGARRAMCSPSSRGGSP